jgi:hypothetical protein
MLAGLLERVLGPRDKRRGQSKGWDDADEDAAAFRERMLREEVPASYRPLGHLFFTVAPGVGALLWAASTGLRDPKPVEWLTVPVTFLVANVFEWQVHKSVLHRRWTPAAILYDRHTPIHHRLYREEDMAMRSDKEWRFVLMPAFAVGSVVAMTAPLAWAIAKATTPNVGKLFLVTAASYMVGYELTHLAYHLPDDHPIAKIPLIQRLRRHHARHHDPRRMQRWNFNVTVPLADWLFGTTAED